jgi:transcription termination factor NusB
MAVDITPGLQDHDARHKIGIITDAHLEGNALVVEGFLYVKDFPDAVAIIRANKATLGMSFEISGYEVADTAADIWTLQRLSFTGAAILRRASAAYEQTAIAASTVTTRPRTEEARMAQTVLERLAALDAQIRTMAASVEAATDDNDADDMDKDKMDSEDEAMDAGETAETSAIEALAAAVATLQETIEAGTKKPLKKPTPTQKPPRKQDMAAGGMMQRMARMLSEMGDGHEDQGEDLDMLEDMIRKYRGQKMAANSQKMQEERLGKIEAAMELLTDTVTGFKGLMTDMQDNMRTLITDRPSASNNGGEADVPQRKTMAAANDPYWMSKFGIDPQHEYQVAEIDTMLKDTGVVDPVQRIAIKNQLAANGKLL